MLKIKSLHKTYPASGFGIRNISFDLLAGKITGIVGPNGSGKTTLLSVITGLQVPDSGELIFNGAPKIGATVHAPSFFPYLTGTENLTYVCQVKGIRNSSAIIEGIMKRVGLRETGIPYKKYSYGMAQRLGIASALIGDPDIIILDEPTNGIDPIDLEDIKMLLKQSVQVDNTILISTHQIDEILELCDFVLCLKEGNQLHFNSVDAVRTCADQLGINFKQYMINLMKGELVE